MTRFGQFWTGERCHKRWTGERRHQRWTGERRHCKVTLHFFRLRIAKFLRNIKSEICLSPLTFVVCGAGAVDAGVARPLEALRRLGKFPLPQAVLGASLGRVGVVQPPSSLQHQDPVLRSNHADPSLSDSESEALSLAGMSRRCGLSVASASDDIDSLLDWASRSTASS